MSALPLLLLLALSKKRSFPAGPWPGPSYPPHPGPGPAPPYPQAVSYHPEPVIVPHPFPTGTSTAVFSAPRPPGVPVFPGPSWTPYTPVPGSVAERAGMLLHTMHMGETRYESGPYGGPVAYHMQPFHADGSGKMVTAWRLKTGAPTVTT